MRVKFLKSHLQYNIGEYADLDDGIAKYLIGMKVATDQEPDNEEINAKLDQHLKEVPKKTKKAKA